MDGNMKQAFREAYFIDDNKSIRWIEPPTDYRILTIEEYEAEQAQKEPLDLTKILVGCEGMELWCTTMGKVKLVSIKPLDDYAILIESSSTWNKERVTNDGKWWKGYKEGECVLFPSKDNRDWSTFKRPAKTIFTNCIGEVFTDEDVKNGITVWWLGGGKLVNRALNEVDMICWKSGNLTSDIFRSKKSLLLWLAEQDDK